MTRQQVTRKAQFRAALAVAGKTAQEWAADHGVTVTHLNYVLAGERESPRLNAALDAFIREQTATLAGSAA